MREHRRPVSASRLQVLGDAQQQLGGALAVHNGCGMGHGRVAVKVVGSE
jgi:cytochrome c551/c552